MEQQEITVCAAIIISGPLVYHLIRWNVSFSTLHDQGVRSCSFSRQPCGKGTAHARPDLCTKGRHCPVTAKSTRIAPRSLCDLSPPHRLCSKEHTAFSV